MKDHYVLLQNAYGTPEMRAVWTEENMVQKWLDMEVAITKAKMELGIIPKEAGEEIIAKSSVKYLTPQMIADVKAGAAHLIVSFIKAFAKMCGPAGEHYHVGPTTQDILDTGLVLQLREAYTILMKQMREVEAALCELAEKYKKTVMMGRTHGQHAVPITFGFKCAIWAYAMRDHIERFKELAKRLFLANISAACGSRNTFKYLVGPEKAEQVQEIVSRELKLGVPVMDIHQRPDRYMEFTNAIAVMMTTLAQMGIEIRNLQRTEVQEVEEPFDSEKQYSSSTMPNKRNPEPSEWLEGLTKIARGNAVAVMEINMQHERDATRMAPEFACIPESCLIASAALATALKNLKGLVVHEDRMRENLYITNGIAMSELVMLALYKKTGKKVTAHTLVHDVSMKAFLERRPLKDVLLENEEARKYLTAEEIDELTNPETYYGTADIQAERMVDYIKKARETDAEAVRPFGIEI
ncbi:MAG: adenylosuccinate lyase [Clostridia bacterium]|nr:adenylosuccinate lyase [Clostridia bacterium]